jgi:hypothetical protein
MIASVNSPRSAVPPSGQDLPDDLFAGPAAVVDRGVDDIASGVGASVHDALGLGAAGSVREPVGEGHRTQK